MSRREAIRLTVVNRRTECPYGYNDGLGGRNLHDCYIDSVTPNSLCVDPLQTGATRCPEIAKLHARYGWRTYDVRPVADTVNSKGQAHRLRHVELIYTPLDALGLRWYATNWLTGQRFAVLPIDVQIKAPGVLHGTLALLPEQPLADTIAHAIKTGSVRVQTGYRMTPEGWPIDDTTSTLKTWNAAAPSLEWRCFCDTCVKGIQ